ncbi:uncharacterized protein SPPG_04458 [Spizellomyces punctatus DAOM BR117]|uniref:Uncharacterized protein n=1 Tax=Spizellomyces punctatus (strain DAOM BR117) TaxID=645134 RepID=A0A0L0HF92_SPIPD|nr:uncharacterized protein SPPG_04458 [Spizellomyces punctatus DAOM BR117]KND00116.1 hypothetical protein SPPG_04458 [Spizellomyces punctatus DAOM BR117]|eukprot:XP_016608155.1 hypothetical protein SPPG_04458 [Spizellomyces punctatus DAOM BR117]
MLQSMGTCYASHNDSASQPHKTAERRVQQNPSERRIPGSNCDSKDWTKKRKPNSPQKERLSAVGRSYFSSNASTSPTERRRQKSPVVRGRAASLSPPPPPPGPAPAFAYDAGRRGTDSTLNNRLPRASLSQPCGPLDRSASESSLKTKKGRATPDLSDVFKYDGDPSVLETPPAAEQVGGPISILTDPDVRASLYGRSGKVASRPITQSHMHTRVSMTLGKVKSKPPPLRFEMKPRPSGFNNVFDSNGAREVRERAADQEEASEVFIDSDGKRDSGIGLREDAAESCPQNDDHPQPKSRIIIHEKPAIGRRNSSSCSSATGHSQQGRSHSSRSRSPTLSRSRSASRTKSEPRQLEQLRARSRSKSRSQSRKRTRSRSSDGQKHRHWDRVRDRSDSRSRRRRRSGQYYVPDRHRTMRHHRSPPRSNESANASRSKKPRSISLQAGKVLIKERTVERDVKEGWTPIAPADPVKPRKLKIGRGDDEKRRHTSNKRRRSPRTTERRWSKASSESMDVVEGEPHELGNSESYDEDPSAMEGQVDQGTEEMFLGASGSLTPEQVCPVLLPDVITPVESELETDVEGQACSESDGSALSCVRADDPVAEVVMPAETHPTTQVPSLVSETLDIPEGTEEWSSSDGGLVEDDYRGLDVVEEVGYVPVLGGVEEALGSSMNGLVPRDPTDPLHLVNHLTSATTYPPMVALHVRGTNNARAILAGTLVSITPTATMHLTAARETTIHIADIPDTRDDLDSVEMDDFDPFALIDEFYDGEEKKKTDEIKMRRVVIVRKRDIANVWVDGEKVDAGALLR